MHKEKHNNKYPQCTSHVLSFWHGGGGGIQLDLDFP